MTSQQVRILRLQTHIRWEVGSDSFREMLRKQPISKKDRLEYWQKLYREKVKP